MLKGPLRIGQLADHADRGGPRLATGQQAVALQPAQVCVSSYPLAQTSTGQIFDLPIVCGAPGAADWADAYAEAAQHQDPSVRDPFEQVAATS